MREITHTKKPQKEAAVSGKMFFAAATKKKSSLFCGKQKEIKAIDHFVLYIYIVIFNRRIQ